nr:hypothetical protein [Ningiella ruwaisensis]
MIPNFDQLLIVCGIALAFVAAIVWILMKLPVDEEQQKADTDKEDPGT